jgi:hypothetical protein
MVMWRKDMALSIPMILKIPNFRGGSGEESPNI